MQIHDHIIICMLKIYNSKYRIVGIFGRVNVWQITK